MFLAFSFQYFTIDSFQSQNGALSITINSRSKLVVNNSFIPCLTISASRSLAERLFTGRGGYCWPPPERSNCSLESNLSPPTLYCSTSCFTECHSWWKTKDQTTLCYELIKDGLTIAEGGIIIWERCFTWFWFCLFLFPITTTVQK